MLKRLFLTVLFFSLSGGAVFAADSSIADGWVWPLPLWDTRGTQHKEPFGGQYHMGTDSGFLLGPGGEVVAAANGVVKEVQERSQFGLVVLIEHTLPDGKKIVSVYGHLRPQDPQVQPGETVRAGQVLGYIGTRKENGGWSPHLHFGIHREPYTGEWKYYGHVNSVDEAKHWYDPAKYISKHFAQDSWKPRVHVSGIQPGTILDKSFHVNVKATDVGSGINTITVELHHPKGIEMLYTASGLEHSTMNVKKQLEAYPDGHMTLRITATDLSGNSRVRVVPFWKKADAKTTPHVAVMTTAKNRSFVRTLYQAGEEVDNTPLSQKGHVLNQQDMAIADMNGDGKKDIVTLNTVDDASVVRITSAEGDRLQQFTAYETGQATGGRIAVGDVNGDGTNEVVVASAPGKESRIKVFSPNGTVWWKKVVFPKNQRRTTGVDIAVGDVNGDGQAEIIAGSRAGAKSTVVVLDRTKKRTALFRGYEKEYTGGVNVAVGDLNGEHSNEILVAPAGGRAAELRVFTKNGNTVDETRTPFGIGYTGEIDVTTTDWEGDGQDDITVSRAENGGVHIRTLHAGKYKQPRVFDTIVPQGSMRLAAW